MFKSKTKKLILGVLLCLCTAFFACGIFAISNTKDKGQTVTAEAAAVTNTYYKVDGTTLYLGGTSFTGSTMLNLSNDYPILEVPWYSQTNTTITTVTFLSNVSPNDVAYWFTNMHSLTTINHLDYLDVSNVARMQSMFYNCDSLTSLDLSTFNVPSGLGGMNYIGGTTVNALKQITLSASLIPHLDLAISSLYNKSWYRIDDNTVYLGNDGVDITEPGTYYDAPHTHSYDTTTWKSDGINHWHECTTCGTVQPNSTDAHTAGAAATCTTAQTCTVCSYVFTPALNHDFTTSPWSSNPTNHWHVCTRTGCTATDTPAAHTFQWVVDTPATVTSTGIQHEECTVCNFAKSQGTVIPIVTCNHHNTTHNAAVTATCMSTGNVEYWHCNDCNKDLDSSGAVITNTSTAIDPNNHSFTNYVYNNDATCTQDGTETATCGYGCGATDTRTKTGTALNHDFTTAPWSTGTSNHWHVCTRTGCTVTDTPAAHTFQWIVDTPATVTSTGIQHEECTVCGYAQSQGTVISILSCAHNNKTHYPAVAATCMQQGNVEYWYCSDCLKNVDSAGLELTTLVTPIDPNNHSYTNYVSNNDANCTTDGTKTAQCDYGCGAEDTVTDTGSATGHTFGTAATCITAQTCTVCNTELAPALGHDWSTNWEKDTTNHWHECTVCYEKNDKTAHTYDWVITKEATTEEAGLMENLCNVCGHKDGEQVIDKLEDPNGNGEIDLPIDVHVEFKVTQSSTDNDYSDIDKGLKRGYWAQLWYRNDDGTLGDEFVDKINCFLTLKIPTDIVEAIRGGEEINRDKIAAGLKVFYIDGDGSPVEVENFTIAMRDDDSWQIKFNYNEKFRAEVVFAADLAEQPTPEPESGIPWWVWLIVGISVVVIIILIVVIALAAKNKKNGGTPTDNGEVIQRLDNQDQILSELLTRGDDGGFNTPVELDENGNVIFK